MPETDITEWLKSLQTFIKENSALTLRWQYLDNDSMMLFVTSYFDTKKLKVRTDKLKKFVNSISGQEPRNSWEEFVRQYKFFEIVKLKKA